MRLWLFLLTLPLAAETVPGRYIVELSTESVAAHVRGMGRAGLRGAEAARHRTRLRQEQTDARAAVRAVEGRVSAAVENVANALIVEIDDSKSARLERLAGVRKVYPVRRVHLLLDHALPLHRVPDAWTQIGIDKAGAGVRIAFIDTGIDVKHPGFNDGGFTAPPGFPVGIPAYTNNKVIVARSYVPWMDNPDPDVSPTDHIGHGTAAAMAAAGVPTAGPLGTITGVAPRAYIGSYKVFGSPAENPSSSEDLVLRALDDAIADGMDVVNLSLGFDVALPVGEDIEMQAVENASALGILVVCAVGNNGPDPMTAGTPAGAPSVIAVGATANDRTFVSRVRTADGQEFGAIPDSASLVAAPVTGKLVDVASLDGNGLACATLPSAALTGAIALISRGTCYFEDKLTNAQAAGAVAALVVNNVDGSPFTMGAGSASLPAEMVSQADGTTIKTTAGSDVTLEFAGSAYFDPRQLSTFSAAGPYIDFGIKPDLVAVGSDVFTATQSLDPAGEMYDRSGYIVTQGTSFSAPLVSGAAAVVKASRPGLTAEQYRSLIVNTAAPAWSAADTRAHVQRAGAGSLDLLAAVTSTAAAAPVSLSFGTTGGTRYLTVSNVGTVADTFQLSVAPLGGNAVPELSTTSMDLAPGASTTVRVTFAATGLTAGQYEGFIEILGTKSTVTTRAPYWLGVASGQPQRITMIGAPDAGSAGETLSDSLLFRVTDNTGLPVTAVVPTVKVVSGGGAVSALHMYSDAPYLYGVSIRLGGRMGANVFRIQAGDLTKDVTVIGQ